MSHNLSLAQNHAYDLARTLMIPVTPFKVDDEYGVMPSEYLEDGEVEVIHEYDPHQCGRRAH
ncbi:hypothetical protein [Mesorhizobium sp. A556]